MSVTQQEMNEFDRRRRELGKAGKLWKAEVLCKMGTEVKKHYIDNRTSDEIMKFREGIFSAGLLLCIDPGHWVIISPWDILQIDLWRQKNFIDH